METDRHYFIEGLFIIGFRLPRRFSSSGCRARAIATTCSTASISTSPSAGSRSAIRSSSAASTSERSRPWRSTPADPRKVQVDVKLRKEAPVKTDTRASLKLKGITGVVFIELNGGAPERAEPGCRDARRPDPGNRVGKSSLTTVIGPAAEGHRKILRHRGADQEGA